MTFIAGAIMAATSLTRSRVFVSFIICVLQFAFLFSSFSEHLTTPKHRIIISRRHTIYDREIEWKATAELGGLFKFTLTKSGYFKSKRAVLNWTKHGQTSLLIPGHDPPLDIAIYLDIATNPGPNAAYELLLRRNRTRVNLHRDFTPKTYTSDQLFKIRRVYSTALPCRIFSDLRNSGMFHFRGSRAGQRNHSPSGSTNAISVCILNNNNYKSARSIRLANYANLVTIKRPPLFRQVLPASKPVEFCLLNACSVKNKSFVIKDFIVDDNIDVLAITETWLQANIFDQLTVNDICPKGFAFHHLPRKHSRGGGVALLYKSRFKLKKLSTLIYASTSLRMAVVYRPPPSQKNRLSVTLFLDEFSSLLEKLVISNGPSCKECQGF